MSEIKLNDITIAYNKLSELTNVIKGLKEKLKGEYNNLPSKKEYLERLTGIAFRFKNIKDPLRQFMNKVATTELSYARLEQEINDQWEIYKQTISEPGKLTLVIPDTYLVKSIKRLPEGAVLHDKDSVFSNFFKPEEGKEINGYLVAVLEQRVFGKDVHTILWDYEEKLEPYLNGFFKQTILEGLQNYFDNKITKGSKELWYEYPVNHPDEVVPILKFVRPNILELNQDVSGEKKDLFKISEREMPEETASKIMDVYYDNVALFREKYSKESFAKLKTEINSYSYFIVQIQGIGPKKKMDKAKSMDQKPALTKGTLQSKLKELNSKNQKLLAEYPLLKEKMKK